MLTRRHIRIKVMQSFYSYSIGKKKKLEDEIVFFRESVTQTYHLYFLILALLKSIKTYVDDQLLAYRKNQIQKDGKYLKFVHLSKNRFLEFIKQHDHLQKQLENKKFIRWDLEFVFMKDLVEKIISQKTFDNYLQKEKPSELEDLHWLIKCFKNTIATSPYLYEYLEDHNLTWIDDLPVINTFVLKTLKKLNLKNSKSLKFPKLKDSYEDLKFGIELLEKSILKEKELLNELKGKTPNWDAGRIASLDLVILKIAITEILYFPNIPSKVSINEYLEIAKDYSTPNSNNFINGVLDKLVREFIDDKRMIKVGRGLL